jgi:hypothetical protein
MSCLECPRIVSTDLGDLRLLATFGDVESVGTSTREIKKLPLGHGAVFIAPSWTGTRGKISKPPRFTKYGQEPILFTSVRTQADRTGSDLRRHVERFLSHV